MNTIQDLMKENSSNRILSAEASKIWRANIARVKSGQCKMSDEAVETLHKLSGVKMRGKDAKKSHTFKQIKSVTVEEMQHVYSEINRIAEVLNNNKEFTSKWI